MTHLSPSFWVHTTSKCSDKCSCLQTKAPCEKLCFCFEMKILPFLGHTKWSTKHSGNNQRGTVKETRSQVLEAVNISAPFPPPPLSLSLHAGADTTSIVHPVLTSRVYCFFVLLINQMLIDISMTFACNGCLSKLCHGRCDGKETVRGLNRYALISVSTTVFDESANSVLNAHSTMVSSLKSWLCYFRSFSKVATKLSCLSLLLDKVYRTFNIILNFEDDLVP